MKTFRYRLYPSKPQARLMASTLETARRWYNDCLEERKTAWDTEQRNVGMFAQMRGVKVHKAVNPFATHVHSHILQGVCADLNKAFQAFFRRVKAGETPGYPRFKGRNRFASFAFKEYGNGARIDGQRLKLSGIGRVAVRWHRPTLGTIKTVRIAREAGDWFACFACDVGEPVPLAPTGRSVGVDVGIAHLVATSDGEMVAHPAIYRRAQAALRIAQRRVSRRVKGGANRRKAVQMLRKKHQAIGNQRRDYLNKLAFGLVGRYDIIALEDLRITNMVRNRHLAKSILDAGWGYLASHLTFKAACAGRDLRLVNPAYTSQTCSHCRQRFPVPLTLRDRWVRCACGMSLDRDVNAARMILATSGDGQSLWSVSSTMVGFGQEAVGL